MRGRGSTTLRVAAVGVALVVGAVGRADADAPLLELDSDKVTWSRYRPDTVVSVQTSRRIVALSFDDGPDPRWTPRVLDLLAEHGMRATFFDEGDHGEQWPDLLRRTAAEGHEVANHTYSHPDVPLLDGDGVMEQVTRANDAFRRAGVEPVPLFRPPKGLYDIEAARAVRATGHLTIGWDVCLERFLALHPDDGAAIDHLMQRVHPGAILLAHDGGTPDRSRTVAILPRLLDALRAHGYEVVTVTQLLDEAR